ncbi:MAG: hypothetical protein ACK5NK_14090 [Niabella sp.]
MKTLLIVLGLLCILSCSKEADPYAIPNNVPAWLKAEMSEIKKDGNQADYVIDKYRFSGAVYYDIRLNIMSCILCNLYNEAGETVQAEYGRTSEYVHVERIWPND